MIRAKKKKKIQHAETCGSQERGSILKRVFRCRTVLKTLII